MKITLSIYLGFYILLIPSFNLEASVVTPFCEEGHYFNKKKARCLPKTPFIEVKKINLPSNGICPSILPLRIEGECFEPCPKGFILTGLQCHASSKFKRWYENCYISGKKVFWVKFKPICQKKEPTISQVKKHPFKKVIKRKEGKGNCICMFPHLKTFKKLRKYLRCLNKEVIRVKKIAQNRAKEEDQKAKNAKEEAKGLRSLFVK